MNRDEGCGVACGPRHRNCNATHFVLAILCTGGPDVIRKEAWPFYRTISGVGLCWDLEEPKGPKGAHSTVCWQTCGASTISGSAVYTYI